MKMRLLAITIAIFAALMLAPKIQAQDSSPAATSGTSTSTTAAAAQKADTEWDGVSVELTGVTRGGGDTITVKWKYTNGSSKVTEIDHGDLTERIWYVDPGNKKKYLVVKDAQGKAVAGGLQFFKLQPGASHPGWAKFPAPPAGVSKIDVYLPGAPPFEGVAITSQ